MQRNGSKRHGFAYFAAPSGDAPAVRLLIFEERVMSNKSQFDFGWPVPVAIGIIVVGIIALAAMNKLPIKIFGIEWANSPSPSSSSTTSSSNSPGSLYDPTKPFLIQLGSDTTPTSAGDEVDRVKQLAERQKLRVDQFKKNNLYVTTIGFFPSEAEAKNARSLIINEIPFFKTTQPVIQNVRQWCPHYVVVGTYLECQTK
jgi:hypothetical protein